MDDKKMTVTLEQVADLEFRVSFGPEFAELLVDEPPPLGGGKGPSPARLLAAAIGSCLSASLAFCLKKSRLEPRKMETVVTYGIERNAAGRLRIPEQHVAITLDMDASAGESCANRCLELFEEFCTVTQSVRHGIDIHVDVKNSAGQELYRSVTPPS